jgi:hypothetical protein
MFQRIMDVLTETYKSKREDEDRNIIAPHVAPELPFHVTRELLVETMSRLPERGQLVVFDNGERHFEDTPTGEETSIRAYSGEQDLVVFEYKRPDIRLDLFGIPRQQTGYTLTVLVPPTMPNGMHSSRIRDCNAATATEHPCATLRVFNGEGVSIASAVDMQRFSETMTVRAASVVFVKDGWDVTLTQILSVGAVFSGVALED